MFQKPEKMLKAKNKYFLKMSKYRNTVYYDFKSHFLVIFFFNYWHCLVLKIPFPDHIFPKISKFCTENLHSPPLANTTLPPPPLAPPSPPPSMIAFIFKFQVHFQQRWYYWMKNSMSLILWLKKLPTVFYGCFHIVAYWIP